MVREKSDEETNKHLPDPTKYGQICRSICLMQRKTKQNKSGLSRSQSSIMPEDYGRQGIYGYHEECSQKVGNSDASSNAL